LSPKQQEKLFRKTYAVELLSIAIADGKTAEFLLTGLKEEKIRGENYFFMVHQTIEKALKAVLVHLGIPVPLVHDLGILLAKFPADVQPPFGYEISRLSDFALVRRYEEGAMTWGIEDANEARALAKQALDWAKNACQ